MHSYNRQRVQWMGEVPASADVDSLHVIGSIPKGKQLTLTACSYYGGDGGERYSVDAIPSGSPVAGTTFDATNGSVNLIYPLAGGVYTAAHPVNSLTENLGISPMVIPGPCILALSPREATTTALGVTILGIMEDL